MEGSDSRTRAIASAFHAIGVSRVQAAAAAVQLDADRYVSVIEEAWEEKSDRASAITIFALFDDFLLEVLKRHFNPGIQGGFESLFEGSGFLSTAHSRIKLAAALSWILTANYHDLNILRQIRNRFAHHIDTKSFNDKIIAGYISSLPKLPDYFMHLPLGDRKLSNRERFFIMSMLCFYSLVYSTTLMPHAIRHMVDPTAVWTDFDSKPENLQTTALKLAAVMGKIFGSQPEGTTEADRS
jgi:DNA-binding MltR family transcriptional regulator